MELDKLNNYFFHRGWLIIQLPNYNGGVVIDQDKNYVAFLNEKLIRRLDNLLMNSTEKYCGDSLKDIVDYSKS
ncbi:hypothetical protein [Bacillus pretiosus]|uniref:hypothetical protein n=1 Tax=Bacillus TaxID=1386 RepID=UPI003D658F0F